MMITTKQRVETVCDVPIIISLLHNESLSAEKKTVGKVVTT